MIYKVGTTENVDLLDSHHPLTTQLIIFMTKIVEPPADTESEGHT